MLEKVVEQFFTENAGMLSVFGHFFVGFSGGIDSTALVLALRGAGARFTAVHFEHHIRGEEAEEDARWCDDFCSNYHIPFLRVDLDVPGKCQPRESLEAAARRLRLEGWKTLAAGRKCAVFLAHHADDCMENLFLRLARGSNVSGILGMDSTRVMGNLFLCRPFLHIRKEQLCDYLGQKGITDWRTDSTNADNDYRRNAIRNQLFPLWRSIFGNDRGLLRSMNVLRQDALFLEKEADICFHNLKNGGLDAWKLPSPMFQRVLRKWLAEKMGEGDLPVSYATIERLRAEIDSYDDSLMASARKKIIPVESGIRLAISKTGGLELVETIASLSTVIWNFHETPRLELPDANAVFQVFRNGEQIPLEYREVQEFDASAFGGDNSVTIRCRIQGDVMQPFGSDKQTRLQDLMVNAKIPADARDRIPVFVHGNRIIWVPGVRRAEVGRITDATVEKIVFCIRPLNET